MVMSKTQVQIKEMNGRRYILFKNGRIDCLPDTDPLSLEQVIAAVEYLGVLEVVDV